MILLTILANDEAALDEALAEVQTARAGQVLSTHCSPHNGYPFSLDYRASV